MSSDNCTLPNYCLHHAAVDSPTYYPLTSGNICSLSSEFKRHPAQGPLAITVMEVEKDANFDK